MEGKKPGGYKVWVPLSFSLVLVAGMLLGFNLSNSLRYKRALETIVQRNDRLEQVIDLINERYVDTVNTNLLYQDAVTGILNHLDPHTVYIPADKVDEENEDLEGSFFGIGVEFSILRDTIQVTSVIEDGPAARAGVQTGDQLIKVGDSIVAGKAITADKVMKMLKGRQYSNVLVTLLQPGAGTRQVTIKRDAVPLYSVEASIMLDSITGFIKINRFSATTYEEFSKALTELKKSGMKQMILDLRQNPGGYLNAATNIADEFLDGEKLIVYTKGRRSSKIEYKAKEKSGFEHGRLTVLVDESSASASEIVAGAIQDWDRGVVLGRRTYGKGLVQEQYDMNDGSALRLTIAKYYTPSGRSIQRSFAKGRNEYEEAFAHRFETGELTGNDSTALADSTKFYTGNGRVVYGGGGIKPDVYVPYDTTRMSSGVLNMLYTDDVKSVVWDYYLKNRKNLSRYKNVKEYANNFRSDEMINQYIGTLEPALRKVALKIISDTNNYNYFRLQMKAQLARVLYRSNGYYSINTTDDRMVKKAKELLYSKDYSQIISR